jgi:hypothetical protein
VFLLAGVAIYLAPMLREPLSKNALLRAAPVVAAFVAVALGVTAVQNKAVTGSWTTLPYQLSQYQYGVPASLTFQADQSPHVPLTPQQELGYKSQLAFRNAGRETIGSYFARLAYRVRYYRFFFLAPLYVAILAFLPSARRPPFAWVLLTLVVFALGTNFFPAFQLHYLAAVTCLFILISVVGLQQIMTWSPDAARILCFLCVAHFGFWYVLHVADDSELSQAARPYETWDAINHRNPERRLQVAQQIAGMPGKLLIFVRYWPQHLFQDEWVWNEADIGASRVVWARDLGEPENEKLRRYYPDRTIYLLEPDAKPPKLEPYQIPEAKPEEKPVETPPPPKPDKRYSPQVTHPQLRFEEVPR